MSGLLLLLALAACSDEGPGATSFGGMTRPQITSASEPASTTNDASTSAAESTSEASPGPDSSTSAASGSSTGETLWDMGVPDFGSAQPAGCRGKIDFLFVIGSNDTMSPFQDRLVAAFPGFMEAIAAQWPDFDIHILSANTNKGGLDLGDCSVCTDGCDPQGEPPFCGEKFTLCDKQIGASVTFPTGDNASNRRCELDSDLRYITSGQHDIDATFACIARVGISGGSVVGQAMVEALSPENNDPLDEDACNRGFVREDALLVVTLIQSQYDEKSLGTVDDWIAALRAAKHGDDDAFAVLVLNGEYGQPCWPGVPSPGENRLSMLAEGVEHGFIGPICEDSFVPFFSEHIGALAELCDEFVAPG